MLEFLAYKKFKKHKKEKEDAAKDGKPASETSSSSKDHARTDSPGPSAAAPILDKDDESFLESLLSDDAPAPALPPRIKTPELSWESDDSRVSVDGASSSSKSRDIKTQTKEKEHRRFSLHFLTSMLDKDKDKKALTLAPPQEVTKSTSPAVEVGREERDITRVLNNLNLSARNDCAFSLSSESADLARRFNLVLRDLVRGVPTAVNDLQELIEDRDGLIERTYERLPHSLKKMVEKLPEKVTASLAPELLAVAAESQGKKVEKSASLGDAAKNFLSPKNMTELVTKPGAVVSMLRAIVNALKLRWPAFIGTNVIWSVAVFCMFPPFNPPPIKKTTTTTSLVPWCFVNDMDVYFANILFVFIVLLFVLWYCYKRGREERLKEEGGEAIGTEGSTSKEEDKKEVEKKDKGKGEERPVPVIREPSEEGPQKGKETVLPPPPIGEHA
jgi:hypothetical protein